MKRRIITLALIGMLLLSPVVALASDITGAKFYGIVTVTNNSTAASDIFTVFTRETQPMIDAGFLNATCNNSAMHDTAGLDTAYQPSVNATYPWCVYVSDIGTNSALNYLLYTGGPTSMNSKIRYFPGTGGMTTADENVSLELSDNFTIEQKGWIDTDNGSDKNYVYKEDAIRTWVSDDEEITSYINTANTTTQYLLPNGAGDYTNILGLFGAATHWQAVDDAVGAPDEDATYVWSGVAGAPKYDAYDISDPTWLGDFQTITSVKVYFRHRETGAADGRVKPGLRLGTDETLGAEVNSGAAYATTNEALTRPGGGGWSLSDIDDLQALIGIRESNAAAEERVTQVYVAVTYTYWSIYVTATGIESGEHTVSVSAAPLLWAPDNVLNFPGTPSTKSNIHCGAIYNNETKLWISMWVNFDNLYGAGVGDQYLWGKRANAANTAGLLFDNASGKLYFFCYIGGNQAWILTAKDSGGSDITTWAGDTWYHILASTSDTAGQRLLVNNWGAATSANLTAVLPNGGTFCIGSDRDPGSSADFDGEIANVAVGTDNLTLVEERELYANIIPADATDLWYIDEGTGTNIISYGTSANDGIKDADPTWEVSERPCKFAISIDSTAEDGFARPASVTNNNNNWTFVQSYSMPYMEYHKITIDGVLQQHIEWEYDTVFSDLSGNDHDATPSFRTGSSDADVSAELTSFLPIEEAKAPIWVLEAARDFWDPTDIEATGEFTTTPSPTFPGKAVIDAVAAASDTPTQLPYTLITGFVILAFSMTASWFMAKHGSRNLWLKVIIISVMMAIFIAMDLFDFWMLVFFLIMAIAIILFSRQRAR